MKIDAQKLNSTDALNINTILIFQGENQGKVTILDWFLLKTISCFQIMN